MEEMIEKQVLLNDGIVKSKCLASNSMIASVWLLFKPIF